MIDPLTEELISLAAAAASLPARRGGKRPHVSCLYRWTVAGCQGVVLDSIQVGGTRCTSREALCRFFADLSEVTAAGGQRKRTAKWRQRAEQRAQSELKEAGY